MKTQLLPTNLYREAARRLAELRRMQEELEGELKHAPKGILRVSKGRKQVQFYVRKDEQDKNGIYLSKEKTERVRMYVQKSYNQKVLKYIKIEIDNLKKFLEKSSKIEIQIKQAYSNQLQEIKTYLNPIDQSDEDFVREWMNQSYPVKPILPNHPSYLTKQGERVRSKSELNIANALFDHGIPYKYECPLNLLDGMHIHPDFTLLKMPNRKEYYWEHRGMMDDREYVKNTVKRVKDYRICGILQGDQLLLTEETSTQPLTTEEIEKMIREFLEE